VKKYIKKLNSKKGDVQEVDLGHPLCHEYGNILMGPSQEQYFIRDIYYEKVVLRVVLTFNTALFLFLCNKKRE